MTNTLNRSIPRMLPCDKCGTTMDMHYGLWCPQCDKPERTTKRVLDYFKVIRHVAHQHADEIDDCQLTGHAQLLWKHIIDDDRVMNDSYVVLHLNDTIRCGVWQNSNPEDEKKVKQMAQWIVEEFNITEEEEDLLWWISW